MSDTNKNPNDGISHSLLVEVINSSVAGQVSVRRTPKKYFIQVQIGEHSKTLTSQRKGVRWFASLDSADRYLNQIGIRNYNVGY